MSKDTIEVPRELLEHLLEYAHFHQKRGLDYIDLRLCIEDIRDTEALLTPPQPDPEEDPRQMHMEL